jgi:hypothetical protein
MTFKGSIWKDDILLNINFKTTILFYFLFKWITSGKLQVQKISNVWKPHFKSFSFNRYMWQNKTFTKKPLNIWKNFLHKLEISFETYNNCKYLCLAHLKLEAFNNLKTSLPQTSNFNVETFNILKNSFTHTWNLNIQKTFFHIWNFITLLKKSLPRLPFT